MTPVVASKPQEANPVSTREKHNPHLDSLRGLAALAIIAMHYEHLLAWGWIGVQFFFVLSGFLISGIILRAREERAPFTSFITTFYKRRSLRLLPLYFGYSSAVIVLYALTRKPEAVGHEWPYVLTYALNFRWAMPDYEFHSFIGHLWSLCVEWQFYLVWPFVLWHIPRHRLGTVLTVTVVLGLAARWVTYQMTGGAGSDLAAVAVYAWPFSHIDAFGFGAALCHKPIREVLCGRWYTLGTVSVVIVTGLLLMMIGAAGYTWNTFGWKATMPAAYQWLWGYTLLNLTSACVIALTIEGRSPLRRITGSNALIYVGTISYGIYIYHSAVVFVVSQMFARLPQTGWKNWVGLGVATVVTLVLAHLSYQLWERRFLLRKQKIVYSHTS